MVFPEVIEWGAVELYCIVQKDDWGWGKKETPQPASSKMNIKLNQFLSLTFVIFMKVGFIRGLLNST